MFDLIYRLLENFHLRVSIDLLTEADETAEKAAHHRARAEYWRDRRGRK